MVTMYAYEIFTINSNFIDLCMYGFSTQRAFHRVPKHLKRSSDEEIMTVQS